MSSITYAQVNEIDESGNITTLDERKAGKNGNDSHANKEIPIGIKVWSIDERFGDTQPAAVDTLSPMFMNTVFTTGLRGEYNTLGNVGSPRINRIFIDRQQAGHFIFTQPYDFFIVRPQDFHFTNTLSPFTNLTYNTCGDRMNGEDHFKAKFGVNVNKKLGFGFHTDYIYGRGYYDSQSTSHLNFTLYGSYLGERYQAHLLASTNHQKIAENGGITNDDYIVHPESFHDNYTTSEIPTVLNYNWNRNDNQHVLFSHRYNIGFNRKVPMTEEEIEAKKFAMASQQEQQAREELEKRQKKALKEGRELSDEEASKKDVTFAGRPDDAKIAGTEPEMNDSTSKEGRIIVDGKATADSLLAAERKTTGEQEWMKNEYVPVTSFIHTVQFDNYTRIFQAYQTPTNYYADSYNYQGVLGGDSIYDKTTHYQLRNTFAISMLEGFNKWMKTGLKLFAASDLRYFTLPDSVSDRISYREHSLSVGGQISKREGHTLHYLASAETWLVGEDAGQMKIDGSADINFPLFNDTVSLVARGFFHRLQPTFYHRHYHGRHIWWDNDNLDKILHTRIEGLLSYQKTHTTLRVAVDEIKNHTYFTQSYTITSNAGRANNRIMARQSSEAFNLLTASLTQDFQLGPLRWESVITYQKSSKPEVIPVPDLNIYTNLFLRFKIARVLSCDFGADARYFTEYYAPDYSPALGQFTVQESAATTEDATDSRVKTGNYPIVNVYANFHLKHTRFFIMMSHINASMGKQNYFLTPHYPLNQRLIRFGISWNFFN